MGFTVSRPGGTKDSDFEAYARLLLQQGKDLGRLPRVAEPGSQDRWLHVWPKRAEAAEFARELGRRTRDHHWEVVQVNAPASEGPLGPVLVQLSRRSDSLVFALHPLSKVMLASARPEAQPHGGIVSIAAPDWQEMLKSGMTLRDLALRISPALTGLPADELKQLGFAVIDDASGDSLVHERPADVGHVAAGAA